MIKDRRAYYRINLHPLFAPIYDALCKELTAEWQPYFGMRTFAEQDALFAQGRTKPGGIVTQARGGESPHEYGCATDWTIWTPGGTPIWMTKEDPRWKIFVDAVTKVGLRPGSEFGDIDHCELKISCSWPRILEVYETCAGDSAIVTAAIKEAMVVGPWTLPLQGTVK